MTFYTWPTDKVNCLLVKGFLKKHSDVYFQKQPRKSHLSHSVTDGRKDKVKNSVALLLKKCRKMLGENSGHFSDKCLVAKLLYIFVCPLVR